MAWGHQATSHHFNQCWLRFRLPYSVTRPPWVNTLRPRQNGRRFADDTIKRIFLNENIRISTKNSLKLVPKGLTNNIPALVLIMAWRRPGDKPLSEPVTVSLLTHICVTRPQWVKHSLVSISRFHCTSYLTRTCWKHVPPYTIYECLGPFSVSCSE